MRRQFSSDTRQMDTKSEHFTNTILIREKATFIVELILVKRSDSGSTTVN